MNQIALCIMRHNRLPLRLRKKMGKFLIGKPPARPYRMALFGDLVYEGACGNHMDDKIYMYGLHESATIKLSRTILAWQRSNGQAPCYMDIGTNSGLHLMCCAPLAEKAYGFEPWDVVRTKAEKNLQINNLSNTKIFACALSDENTEMDFLQPCADNLGVGTLAIEEYKAEYGDDESKFVTVKTPVRRGDDVAKEENITPSLIKIDVEGLEKKVLRGLSATIKAHKPAIIFEYSALSRKDFDDLKALTALFDEDYSFWGILRSRENPVLRPFRPGKRYENVLAWPDKTVPDFPAMPAPSSVETS